MTVLLFAFVLNFSAPASGHPEKIPTVRSTEKVTLAKSRFIVFSGSDWCKGCIQFRKKVLDDPSFQTFARENLDIVVADFPQRTRLEKEVVAENEALAEKYNPKGVFPKLVLISEDGSHFDTIPYANQTPQEFVNELKDHLRHLNG